MGEVYRARDPRLDRDVAVKILPPTAVDTPDRLRRFSQEARAAGAINHPNIVAVLDVGFEGQTPYVVSELLEGSTLREKMSAGGLAARKAVEYAAQIAHGLSGAHEKGIVHRDLKPENLFVTRDGRLKILDFGLAKLEHPPVLSDAATGAVLGLDNGTPTGIVMGTVGYMAPEQVRGQAIDHRADIFAFGAILYEMLTGQRAFRGPSAADTMSAILNREPPEIVSTHGPVALPMRISASRARATWLSRWKCFPERRPRVPRRRLSPPFAAAEQRPRPPF
jgi:serine/threonine protein kinase